MRTRSRSFPFLPLLGTLVIAACGDSTGPGDVTRIEQLPRELTADEETVIKRSNAFGLELLARVSASDERPTLVLSPLSASMALGMTLNGAVDSTHVAMAHALQLEGLDQDAINTVYRDLIDLLVTLDPSVQFNIANAIWASEEYPFHQDFFERVEAAFDARVENADFGLPETVDEINAWVHEKTGGKIERIVDALDPSDAMMLLNAIDFDGPWTQRFDPGETTQVPFTRPDGSTVTVSMMNMSEGEFGLGGVAGIQAAELPYGGGAFTLVVMMPDDGDVRSMVASLDASRWEELTGSLTSTEVDGLSFPKLRLTYDTYLNDALSDMGMGIAFVPQADFSGMSPVGDQFCINYVRQKTFMEVDEAGTRAAAVTAVSVGVESFTGIVVDRPFAFAIRERLSGTILFAGLVEDPTAPAADPEDVVDLCG